MYGHALFMLFLKLDCIKSAFYVFPFVGTAISVYFILSNIPATNAGTGTTRNTECNFTLDGIPKGRFEHQPTQAFDQGLEYNVEVFQQTGLENKKHVLEITTGQLDHEAYISFDYARYT
ncbi:hypothetical protein L218DRAFT_169065 [Marasmius fiardii PR-910]|nr:hypothetical protein L218DRAFT_169065 [Marasmius fiardii PR-910]